MDAPTVDPNAAPVEEVKDDSFTMDMGQEKIDTYSGPPIELPSLVDVVKKKQETKKAETKEALKEPEQPKTSAVMDAQKMEYFDERNEIEATGNVVITTYPEKTTLRADRAVFNKNTNVIKFYDNVVLNKDGSTLKGDYMSIDLNEENILMNEPIGTVGKMVLRAQEGYAYANEIQMINGDVQMAKDFELMLQTKGFGYYDSTIVQRELSDMGLRKKRSEPLKIKTKEIIIEGKRDHDNVTLKKVDIYYKKFKLASADSVEIMTDKTHSYVESNLPEIGMIRDFGSYIGWGYATEMPFGGTLKVMPALVYNSGAGIGVIGRYRSQRNMVEAAWGTSSENLIVQGKYEFNKNLYLDYGRHGYFDEWFYGRRQPGYIAQLVHDKTYNVPDLGARYKQRFSGGYVTDYGLKESDNTFGTMRLRWQGELSKTIFEKKNPEQDMYIRTYLYTQAGATLYGTGDAVGIVRFGPSIQTRVKNWGSRISYGMAGIHNESPLMFDKYVYGKQFITIDENIRLGRFLAVGYQGTISPLRDNYKGDILTENKFYVIAGPDDVKVAFSYDTYRERALFDVFFMVGNDNSKIKYDKLTARNMDKAGKKTSPFENFKFYKVKVPENI